MSAHDCPACGPRAASPRCWWCHGRRPAAPIARERDPLYCRPRVATVCAAVARARQAALDDRAPYVWALIVGDSGEPPAGEPPAAA